MGTAVNFAVSRTFKWIKGMPKLSRKVQRLKQVFPDFEGHDEFVKGCSQAMEALQTMSNERDIVGARGCMTDAMFDIWQQAIALADSEDHTIDVTQSRVLNACVVNVAIDDLKAPPPLPSISNSVTDFDICRATFNTLQLVAYVDVLLHATETKVITFEEQDAHSKTRKVIRHTPFIFRIMRFRSQGAALDWKLDAVGPPGAPPQKKGGRGDTA